jgi:hypothetical protein
MFLALISLRNARFPSILLQIIRRFVPDAVAEHGFSQDIRGPPVEEFMNSAAHEPYTIEKDLLDIEKTLRKDDQVTSRP